VNIASLIDDGYAWTAKRIAYGGDPGARTPCAEWSLRQLLNHLLGALDLHLDAVAGRPVDPSRRSPDIDRAGDDPARVFAALAQRAATTWREPGVLDRTAALPMGTVPARVVASLHLTEVVVHGWDIGQATGERTEIPAPLAAPILEFCHEFTPDAFRGTAFAAELPPPSDSPADQLLAFLGRAV